MCRVDYVCLLYLRKKQDLQYTRPIICSVDYYFFPMARQPLGGLDRLIFRGFAITLFRHTALGRTPLDEWPARRRDLYLTTHNTRNRQTSMPPWDSNPQS
jgi:hypothetical protein